MWLDHQKLSLIIAKKRITIKALCMDAGLTQSAICKLLKGNRKPRLSTFGNEIAPGKYRPLTHLWYAWLYCCKKVGIENYRMHDIRHWAVTKLLMAGNTERDVASIAGWKDTTMIKVYYLADGRRSARSIKF